MTSIRQSIDIIITQQKTDIRDQSGQQECVRTTLRPAEELRHQSITTKRLWPFSFKYIFMNKRRRKNKTFVDYASKHQLIIRVSVRYELVFHIK